MTGFRLVWRLLNFLRLLVKTFSRDVVAAKADELHAAQHGGKSNLKEALWTSKYALRTLVAAELIQLQPDGSFLFKR